ncbi:MAG: response regulator transcription factor [Clostridia bacterium]|nr:response regulator transcription factor [Clostridia bacterium]
MEADQLKEQTLRLLPETLGRTEIDVYASARQFLNADQYYDLMLIDCLLPDLSGVELAKTIRRTNRTTAFIFTTFYMDYAVEGYETNAMRYLLKPVEDRKLQEALSYFAKQLESQTIVELTGTTRYATFVKKNEILYVEYVGRKLIVRLENKSVESHRTMKELTFVLGDEFFFRTSQRFLVNFKHIAAKNDKTLVIDNGEHVTISGRRLMPFNQAYIQFLKRS